MLLQDACQFRVPHGVVGAAVAPQAIVVEHRLAFTALLLLTVVRAPGLPDAVPGQRGEQKCGR